MELLRPRNLSEALAAKAQHAGAVPLAGGTDLMVELNFDRRRPDMILDLTRVAELRELERVDGSVRIGAGVTYSRLATLADALPGLALAARTVGSPQIRNRGTLGGNFGTASPAGDGIPPLIACGAQVEVASQSGARTIPAADFITEPKKNALRRDELITALVVPVASGPQQFAKVGTRNAMVIAVCSFALALDAGNRRAGSAIGSAGPRPLTAPAAEALLAAELPWDSGHELSDDLARRFGKLVADAASPIDDVRGTARYRRHALTVLAQRTLSWAWDEYRGAG